MPLDRPISRRVFLRRGALASAAALAGIAWPSVPWISGAGSGTADAAIMGIGQELRDILNLQTCDDILAEALKRGGTWADLFAQQRFITAIVLDGGNIESVTYGYPRGAGVRVLRRQQTGYAFSDDISYNAILDAALVASSVVENQSPVTPIDMVPRQVPAPFTLAAPAPVMDEQAKFDFVRRVDAAARAVDSRIVSVRVEYNDEVRDVLIGTSDGGYYLDRQYLVSLTCAATAVEGNERRTGQSAIGGRVDASYFAKRTPEAAGREAAEQALILLQAGVAPAGSMPVVIGPGAGGVFIHEALGHALEGNGIRKETSVLAGKVGIPVASPLLRVVDDARVPFGRGSYAFDDEGSPGQRTVLVDKGILQSYILDRQSAALLGLKATGNGRRMNYRYPPLPRMSNIFIDRGPSDPSTLLSGIKKGLYCASMGDGASDPTSGTFDIAVREAYLIEDGRLTNPVRGAVLVGSTLDALKRIEGVGNDLYIEPSSGTCLKDGQSLPIGVGQPTVRFSALTVGGRAV